MAELPARYIDAWTSLANAASRRRVEIDVLVAEGSEAVDDGTVLRGDFIPRIQRRGGGPVDVLPKVKSFDAALESLAKTIQAEPLPGPDALREELRSFGRRLAVLQPRDVAKKSGADVPIYRIFRDRILPLAWDNLVDSVRLEALEDFVRKVGAGERGTEKGARNTMERLAAEARGLVGPKKEEGDGEASAAEPGEPGEDVQPAPSRARRSRPTKAARPPADGDG